MTIKKVVFMLSIVAISLSTFASDMLPVAAPILAVENTSEEKAPAVDTVVESKVIAIELPPIQVPAAPTENITVTVQDQAVVNENVSNEPAGEPSFAQPESRQLAAVENIPSRSERNATELLAIGSFSSQNTEQRPGIVIEKPAVASIKENRSASLPIKLLPRKVEAPSLLDTFAGYFDSLVEQVKAFTATERNDVSAERIPETVSVKTNTESPVVEAAKTNEATSILVPFARVFASISEELSTQPSVENLAISSETAISNEAGVATTDSVNVQPDSNANARAETDLASEVESSITVAQSDTNGSLSNETEFGAQASTDIAGFLSAAADGLRPASEISILANGIDPEVTTASYEIKNSIDASYVTSLLMPESEIAPMTADHRFDALIIKPAPGATYSAISTSMFDTFVPSLASDQRAGLEAEAPVVTYSAISTSMFDTFVPSLAADQKAGLRIEAPIEAYSAISTSMLDTFVPSLDADQRAGLKIDPLDAASVVTPDAEVASLTADNRFDALVVKPEAPVVAYSAASVPNFDTLVASVPAENKADLRNDPRVEALLVYPEVEVASLTADQRSDVSVLSPEVPAERKTETALIAFSATSTPMFDTFVPSLAADQRNNLRNDPSAAVAVAGKPSPVLISNDAELSTAQLPRFAIEPLPVAERFADTISSFNRGPNAETTILSEALPKTNADAKNSTMPTLIGGKTMFSNDLLKPMKAPASKPAQVVQGYCDPSFVGEPIRFSQTVELKLEDLLSQLHTRFGVNFIMGPNIGKKPLNVKAGSIPWNVLLRSQLFISGVRAKCIDGNTIELVENTNLPQLYDGAPVTSRFIKLKYLQRTSGGTVDLANRSQGGQNGGQGGCGGAGGGQSGGSGGGTIGGGGGGGGGQMGQTASQQGSNRFDQLITEIEKIIGIRSMQGGSGGGISTPEEKHSNRSVTQIPGRNILLIKATEDEHNLIDEIIARADRPPFQVVIKALVYSANQDLSRDIGVQTSIRGGNGSGRTNGGVLGNTLGVGTLFDFSTIIGTFDFNVQMTALQQNGVISVKSRPFATVLDGLCTTLSVGTKLPIVIDGGLAGEGGITILNADNLLAVTPYVVDDENGNPVAVTLELNLQANVIDSTITARGVPAVNSKSIQTQLLLAENKTAILGGFSIDQDSKSFSKVPGLGDIPVLGELFKRRIRDNRLSRLYFAISVDVVPYPEALAPVVVPGATTDPQTITTEMKNRAEEAEPKPVDPNKPYEPKRKKDNN